MASDKVRRNTVLTIAMAVITTASIFNISFALWKPGAARQSACVP